MNLGLGLGLPFSRVAGASFVGPLDDYTTSLSLALLPFRGFSSYNGALWRVRDTNDDSEQDVAFDADGQPVFPTLVGNGGIRYWYDQSGNANDLPQATAAAQPFLTDNVVNGYPVARFDGTNDYMTGSCVNSQNRTIYMVARMRSSVSNARLSNDSLNANASLYDNGSASYWYYLTSNGIDPVGGTTTNWSLVTLKYSGGNTVAPYVNNTAATPFGAGAYYASGGAYWLASDHGGAASFSPADIACRLQYDAAHDDTTRQAIQTILATQFNITLA